MGAPDWLAIEGAYRAGEKSVNALAKEYGVSEGGIRKRAKKEGWLRDPATTQREKVKAHFAGGTNAGTNPTLRTIADSAARAIADEELALDNAELALRRVNDVLSQEGVIESADLKRYSETNLINLNAIRTIFTLNDPNQRDGVGYDDLPFPD